MAFEQMYDRFIGMGLNCEVTAKINKFSQNSPSAFFSWAALLNLDGLYRCIVTGPDLLLSKSVPFSKNMFSYKGYGVAFHGKRFFREFPAKKEEYDRKMALAENELICRMGYLWNKFESLFTDGKRTLFIIKIPEYSLFRNDETRKMVVKIRDALLALNKKARFDILVTRDERWREPEWGLDRLRNRYIEAFMPRANALGNANNEIWLRSIFHEFQLENDPRFSVCRAAILYKDGDIQGMRSVLRGVKGTRLREKPSEIYCLARTLHFLGAEGMPDFMERLRETLYASSEIEHCASVGHFMGGDLDRALMRIRLALRMNPNQPQHYNHLGKIRFARGEYAEAEAAQRMAVGMFPGIAEYQFDLGCAMEKTGRLSEAAEAVSRAISLKPRIPAFHERLAELQATLEAAGRKRVA